MLELTWWIPRTSRLIEVGCIGGSCGRIASWVACETLEKTGEKKIVTHLNRAHFHTGSEQDVHRWSH